MIKHDNNNNDNDNNDKKKQLTQRNQSVMSSKHNYDSLTHCDE